jgi:hypothetical protein
MREARPRIMKMRRRGLQEPAAGEAGARGAGIGSEDASDLEDGLRVVFDMIVEEGTDGKASVQAVKDAFMGMGSETKTHPLAPPPRTNTDEHTHIWAKTHGLPLPMHPPLCMITMFDGPIIDGSIHHPPALLSQSMHLVVDPSLFFAPR